MEEKKSNNLNSNNPISRAIEIETNRLYWISDNATPKCRTNNAFYFSIDDALVYSSFNEDFGPLNLSMTHKFCLEVEKIMIKNNNTACKIYHYTSLDYKKRANAAYLMGAYLVICKEKSAEEAWSYFENVYPPFIPFRDVFEGESTHDLTILDCLRALEYAIRLGWYEKRVFKGQEYDLYDKLDNGDLNWIIPGKIFAFSSPLPSSNTNNGDKVVTFEDLIPLFKKFKVKNIVTLKHFSYLKNEYQKNNIKFLDLYFEDGEIPTEETVNEFFKFLDQAEGVIGVNCEAGLGRTGTLIAAYAIKSFRFPARAFIGWIRICRPGSIMGPQQQFLVDNEENFIIKGENYRRANGISDEICLKIRSPEGLSDKKKK